jgi:DNA polymerase-3 subunit beta
VVRIEQDEAACQVFGKSSHFMVYGFDPDDFPVAMVEEQPDQIEIQAGVLRRMIRLTAFAVAKESTRYAINGVYWERRGKKLRLVGTDGRRLALVDGTLTKVEAAETAGTGEQEEAASSVIVPVKVMQTIEKALLDPEEKVRLHFTDKKIVFANSLVKISANLVQGRYPNYADVIPKGGQNKAVLPTQGLLSAMRQVALLVNESARGVKLEFSDNHLHLSSSTPEAGNAEVDLEVQYDGAPLAIGFNPDYVIEALRAIDEPEVVLEMIDGNRPGLMRVGKEYQYVIMPVTV